MTSAVQPKGWRAVTGHVAVRALFKSVLINMVAPALLYRLAAPHFLASSLLPLAISGIPPILCGECKGNATIKGACKACGESGLENCAKCGGKGARDGKSPERPNFQEVYQTAPCDACGGKGWPLANVALPCERCFGLAVRIKPSFDPTKVLE